MLPCAFDNIVIDSGGLGAQIVLDGSGAVLVISVRILVGSGRVLVEFWLVLVHSDGVLVGPDGLVGSCWFWWVWVGFNWVLVDSNRILVGFGYGPAVVLMDSGGFCWMGFGGFW
jgi:hypothetical protein